MRILVILIVLDFSFFIMHIICIAVHIEKLTNAHYLLPNFLELKEAISLFFIMGNDHGKIFVILKFSRNLLLCHDSVKEN